MFELLPYGAITHVECVNSSKKGNIIKDYTSSTEYTTVVEDVGKNNSYFLISEKEPIEMEYQYTSVNGNLVEIITNLRVVTNENIRDDGDGHYSIINQNWIDSGNGSFTISSDTWFANGKSEEPYVKLCFNKVKVECCFTNPWHGQQVYGDNGWLVLANDAEVDRLKPVSEAAQNYCILNRYITVSWNKSESNQLLFGQYANEGHWYQIWFSYMNDEDKIVDFDGYITGTTTKVNEIMTHRLYSGTEDNPSYTTDLCRLDGKGTIGGITPYNYLKIGYTINFHGESSWQPASSLSINENNYSYDTRGFIYKENLDSDIISQNSSPIIYSVTTTDNWISNSKFYKTSNNKYVSPSDGLQIISNWPTGNYCVPYDICPNDGCYGYGQCPQDGICSQDGGYQPWTGIILYNNTNIVDSSGNLVRYGSQGEEVTVIGEYTMPGTGQLYYQIGANQYINYHSIERKPDGCTSDCPTDQGGCSTKQGGCSDYWCNYQCADYDCGNFIYCSGYEEYSCPDEGCIHCWSEGGCPSVIFH